jgi:hypothetical protein
MRVLTVEPDSTQICALYAIRNPEKLAPFSRLLKSGKPGIAFEEYLGPVQ